MPTPRQKKEIEIVMNLALDWLDTWDILDNKKHPAPEKVRVAAMHKLKDAVTGLVIKAMPNDQIEARR